MPQKINAAVWKKEVGDNYHSVYEVYLHTLGNLTITGHNSELGTKPFVEKKKIIQENSKANILNKDVLVAERWDEASILKRAERLSDILIREFGYVDIHSETEEINELGFGVESGIDFSNTKPDGFAFIGEFVKISNWVDLLTRFIGIAYDLDAILLNELANNDYSIPNASNVYISNDKRKLRKAKQLDNSGIFYETNLSANGVISFVRDLLLRLGLDTDEFVFTLSEGPFDINDEHTWIEGRMPVARLFYNLLSDLVERSLIEVSEIEKLKTKEYTKALFKATDYPAIADNRTDNMGNSSQIRYRANSLKYKGNDIYVSTQFFDSDRNAIIEWYKKHLR